ncbi:prion-like protein doppel [Meriones unguiculatus]|uniref:prion-like protein doppel n=1 Tax=Meriones unguiculatus TaxID=10047 RepID=UPI000B4FB802|nr:prion-like protein doppel [Meriones unguiculatus]XP_060227758.1 prion-like protein doppel [Meriones unguiculatus]
MKSRLVTWGLAILCMLLASHLSMAKGRGIKHRFKWNRKALPSGGQITEARVAENRPGTFIKQGRKLNIDLGVEGNRYYEANYWQFPDGIYYEGCSDANVTKEMLVASCINATQAANQAEFSLEKLESKLHQRVLWRLIKEICATKRCEFWLERGAALRVAVDQPAVVCLLGFIWFIVK